MPTKTKTYPRVIFRPEVIRPAVDVLTNAIPLDKRKQTSSILQINVTDVEGWRHDTDEEFFADYRRGFQHVYLEKAFSYNMAVLVLTAYKPPYSLETRIAVTLPSRADVEKVFDVFEAHVAESRIPEPEAEATPVVPRRIFIGHGQDLQWRQLKDHLGEMQGYEVEAFESGPKGGFLTRDVLEGMLHRSSFALLVLTAEDKDSQGRFHARENVVHELGLFQGRWGWAKAVALVEEGVTEFSNIHGVTQIRFAKGRIQEAFGEVVATIRREFP